MIIPTDTYVRAARELLRWDQKKLALQTGLSLVTIRRCETGHALSIETVELIARTFEKAGVRFIEKTVIDGLEVTGALALLPSARPDARPDKREYEYEKPPGRPPKHRVAKGQRGGAS